MQYLRGEVWNRQENSSLGGVPDFGFDRGGDLRILAVAQIAPD